MAKLKSVVFQVVGDNKLHCSGCENAVKLVLGGLPSVRKVEASHKRQEIKMFLDDQTVNPGRIAGELEKMGYIVEEIQQN